MSVPVSSLLISNLYLPKSGGVEVMLDAIARNLPKGSTTVLAPKMLDSAVFDEQREYPIVRWHKSENRLSREIARIASRYVSPSMVRTVLWYSTASQLISDGHFDVVQCGNLQMGLVGYLLLRRHGIPYVIYGHGDEIEVESGLRSRTFGAMLTAMVLSKSIVCFANSTHTAKLFLQRGVCSKKIVILPPGCELNDGSPTTAGRVRSELGLHDRRVICSVARLTWIKGHDIMLQALPELLERYPDLIYMIVGDGPMRSQLQDMVVDLGIQASVLFTGNINNRDIGSYYTLSEVMVLPSRSEGLGLSILEANSWGVPVVATKVGGIPDILEHGVNGELVGVDDVQAIAASVSRLLEDREYAMRMGKTGRQMIVNRRNWRMVADAVQEELAARIVSQTAAQSSRSIL